MNKSSREQAAAARLALHASRGQPPRGPEPSEEELAQLLDDRLEFSRKQEIYSHLNANPELYRQWLLLAESHAERQAQSGTTENHGKNPFHWLRWFGASSALAGLAAVLVIAPWRDTPPSISVQHDIAREQKAQLEKRQARESQRKESRVKEPQVEQLPQTAGTQVILSQDLRDALKGMADTLVPAETTYRTKLESLASTTAQNSGFYAFGVSLGQLQNACAGDGKIEKQLRSELQTQAEGLNWPSGPLSLTMARMGMEQDLCALAEELREEIFGIEAPGK
ncbi:hypothetical protein [Microbulbifer aggregans]|uniref:hypothetical protein n=1 Tax=Microbulbifer aggregans TaxID=1769779 RepID=UPI001CFCCEFF|nr:hypothetical protein [Microbulbifer aggregans]